MRTSTRITAPASPPAAPVLAARRFAVLLAAILAAVLVLVGGAVPVGAQASTTALEIQFADLVNAERSARGLAPLHVDVALVASARGWSARMAGTNRLGHDGARWAASGATAWAENVGYVGQPDVAARLHERFMQSPGHRRNILSPRATHIGIGAVVAGGRLWVTQRFTAGTTAAAVVPAVRATAELAQRLFGPRGATRAVIVRDDAFADALAAGPLARGFGPLLFTPRGPALYPHVRAALEDTLPRGSTVMIVGGRAAVSGAVEAELRAAGWNVERYAGEDRFATAAAVAGRVARHSAARRIVLTTGADWPDAAAAGAFGARTGVPLLLTHPDRLPEPTRRALADLRPRTVTAVGGSRAVSQAVVAQTGARRVSGRSREATSAAIAQVLWDRTTASSARRWIAVPAYLPESWIWALGAAPMAARLDAPVLLTGDQPAREIDSYLSGLGYRKGRSAELLVHGPVHPGARERLAARLR